MRESSDLACSVNDAGTGKGARLSWRDLSVYVVDKKRNMCKQLINNAKGVVMSGDLTAILGESGAGKSSLMTTLAYRNYFGLVVQGDMRVNGQIVNPAYMRENSGFLYQDEIFIGTMTVSEHLWFMARMKLDRRMTFLEIKYRIKALMQETGLSSKWNVRVGTGGDDKVLSGGEKKRLAFATELLTEPSLLFLDEPTTGQDAQSANLLIAQLSSLAKRGTTILCTIHQPSSSIFKLFDRIILLANGRIAFAGTNQQAINFFSSLGYACPENYNPADFYISTLAMPPKDDGNRNVVATKICDAFLTSDMSKEIDTVLRMENHLVESGEIESRLDHKKVKPTNAWMKLFWLTSRGLTQVLRDPSIQVVRLLQNVVVSVIVGLCFTGAINPDQFGIQAVQGVLFVMVAENTFSPMYATLSLFPRDLPLFLREYHAGLYPTYVYYISRVLSLIPGLVVEPILFTSFVYVLAGLRQSFVAFGFTLMIVMLTLNVSTACGCFFSSAFNSESSAIAYLVAFDYILMITMGPFAKLGSLPFYIQWIRYVSWLFHSNEALSIIQWSDIRNISCSNFDENLPCITSGSAVLEHYDFIEDNFWIDIIAMLIIYTKFHLLSYLFLCKRCRMR